MSWCNAQTQTHHTNAHLRRLVTENSWNINNCSRGPQKQVGKAKKKHTSNVSFSSSFASLSLCLAHCYTCFAFSHASRYSKKKGSLDFIGANEAHFFLLLRLFFAFFFFPYRSKQNFAQNSPHENGKWRAKTANKKKKGKKWRKKKKNSNPKRNCPEFIMISSQSMKLHLFSH